MSTDASKRSRGRRKDEKVEPQWRNGVDLVITYKSDGINSVKDRQIREAIDSYDRGSGFSFPTRERDHVAVVPRDRLPQVLRALQKVRGIRVKKRVEKWVVVR